MSISLLHKHILIHCFSNALLSGVVCDIIDLDAIRIIGYNLEGASGKMKKKCEHCIIQRLTQHCKTQVTYLLGVATLRINTHYMSYIFVTTNSQMNGIHLT